MNEVSYGTNLTDYIELGKARPWADWIDLCHFLVMASCLVYTFVKLTLMKDEPSKDSVLFLTFQTSLDWVPDLVMDVYEVMTVSPRFLALFTMCFMGRVKFTGQKDTWNAVQYTIVKQLPGYIAIEAAFDCLIRRSMLITLDDVVWMLLYQIVLNCNS